MGFNSVFKGLMPAVLKVCKIDTKNQLCVWSAGVGKCPLDGRL